MAEGAPEDPSRFEWVDDPERFALLAEPWDRLAATDTTPFSLHAWFWAWWSAFGEPGSLRVCLLWRGERLAAALPLVRIGGGLATMANDHTPLIRPIALDQPALRMLADELAAAMPGQVVAAAMPRGEPGTQALVEAGGRRRRVVMVAPQRVSPIVDTSGDFESWRSDNKRRWGSPIERLRRKGQRERDARIGVIEEPRELKAELRTGFEMEARGWKGRAGTAVLSDPRTEAFYASLARAFHARDALRLSTLRLDGRVAAFDYSLLHGNRLWLLKTAYDEEFAKLAPGLVLRLSVIERCFELGLAAHELLGGEEAWKLKFSTGERPLVTVRCYRRTPVALGRYAYRRRVRPVLREVRASLRTPAETRRGR